MIAKDCLDRKQLERYLNGWTDESASDSIEEHIARCPECELTVSQLENETSIGLPLHDSAAEPDDVAIADCGDAIDQAIAKVRDWDGSPDVERREPAAILGDFGNYELCELVGRGGMAEVYRGRHKRLQRDVAIKLLQVPKTHIQESLNRIEREVLAVGRLKHPSIVSAVDAGEHNGMQYLVTEFIDGVDAGKIARACAPVPVAEACEMIRQAALGLDHAHSHGIVHRDIKPSNLMIDRSGAVKILDFGLVRLNGWAGVAAEVTTVGQLLGTLDYMAPEQADRADSVDHRSDIYALGATLFRLLAGRAPFAVTQNQSPLEKLRLLATDSPPKIRTLRPDVPEPLAEIIDQTLDRDPARRPASAAHLAERIEPFCSGAKLDELVRIAENVAEPEPELHPSAAIGIAVAGKSMGTKSDRWRTARRWLVGLGFAAAAIFAGVIIVLETQKGQIVIETDSPNIHVTLLEDGSTRKELELIPGENSTRMYAGRYEIRIDDGTDNYVIENNAFILKRGEKVVAKIRIDESAGKANIDWSQNSHAFRAEKQAIAASEPLTEPVYEGHNLQYWLNRGEFDVSGDVNEKANMAIQILPAFNASNLAKSRAWLEATTFPAHSIQWRYRVAIRTGLNQTHAKELVERLHGANDEVTLNVMQLLCSDSGYRIQKLDPLGTSILEEAMDIVSARPIRPSANFISHVTPDFMAITQLLQQSEISPDEMKTSLFLKKILDADWLGPRVVMISPVRPSNSDSALRPVVQISAVRLFDKTKALDSSFSYYLQFLIQMSGETTDPEFAKRMVEILDAKLLEVQDDERSMRKLDDENRSYARRSAGQTKKGLFFGNDSLDTFLARLTERQWLCRLNDGTNLALSILEAMNRLSPNGLNGGMPGMQAILKSTEIDKKRFDEIVANGIQKEGIVREPTTVTIARDGNGILLFRVAYSEVSALTHAPVDADTDDGKGSAGAAKVAGVQDLDIDQPTAVGAIVHVVAKGLIKTPK